MSLQQTIRLLSTGALISCVLAACEARPVPVQPIPPVSQLEPSVPEYINPTALGPQSFNEDFSTFDHGVDQERPRSPHRWRTVYGIGPTSPDNRTETANHVDHIYMDPDFGGLTGCRALGIDPFFASPGKLEIRAQRLNDEQVQCLGRHWSSGIMTTKLSFSQKWGYFEADMSVPLEAGFWPAFWLLPVNGRWPEHGEIDILESVGPASPGGIPKPHVGVVWKSPVDGSRSENATFADVSLVSYHKYGVLWTPKTVNFYYDRHLTWSAPTPPGLTEPMYMIVNLAVGAPGSWPGEPRPETNQVKLEIRNISAWKLKENATNKF